jgi:hypothetical protein
MSPMIRFFDAVIILSLITSALMLLFIGVVTHSDRVTSIRKSYSSAIWCLGLGLFTFVMTAYRSRQFGDVIPTRFGFASMQPWQGYVAATLFGVAAIFAFWSRRRTPPRV